MKIILKGDKMKTKKIFIFLILFFIKTLYSVKILNLKLNITKK